MEKNAFSVTMEPIRIQHKINAHSASEIALIVQTESTVWLARRDSSTIQRTLCVSWWWTVQHRKCSMVNNVFFVRMEPIPIKHRGSAHFVLKIVLTAQVEIIVWNVCLDSPSTLLPLHANLHKPVKKIRYFLMKIVSVMNSASRKITYALDVKKEHLRQVQVALAA